MAQRILRPASAFSQDLSASKRKRPREHDKDHLAFIRQLPCLITGKYGVDACHVRYADPAYGKIHTPLGQKPHDRWVVPMHREVHIEQHEQNEREFWSKQGIDPLQIASALWLHTGDVESAELVIAEARRKAIKGA